VLPTLPFESEMKFCWRVVCWEPNADEHSVDDRGLVLGRRLDRSRRRSDPGDARAATGAMSGYVQHATVIFDVFSKLRRSSHSHSSIVRRL
jgi:hypothetical protein